MKRRWFILPVLLFLTFSSLNAQRYIRNIYFEKHDVFDSAHHDWFFAARLVNALHATTRDYIIEDELLFTEGDELDQDLLEETGRNLRLTLLFTRVSISTADVGYDSVDVTIITQDKWSLLPAVLFGTGGGNTNIGGSLREENLAGTGILLGGYALHRTENSIGWQGYANLYSRRFLRSEFQLNAQLLSNRIRTDQLLGIEKPFFTMATRSSYGLMTQNSYGEDFLYQDGKQPELLPFHVRRISGRYGRSAGSGDRFYWTVQMSAEDIQRLPGFRQAFDNSGHFLFSLGSLKQSFIKTPLVDGYEVKDVSVGAWGQAVLGYTFPFKGGERLYYVGARAEQSGLFSDDHLYLYGTVEASSAFAKSEARYTYLESSGLAHYRFAPNLVLAARFRQQTAWNWSAFRQLVLDNDAGLRGYRANVLTGENRALANLELRFFPQFDFWIFRLGATAFYDAGAVWNQTQNIVDTKVHNSVGLGLRIFNLKMSGPSAILRIDFAYNFDEKKFAGIIFSSDQLFSAFGGHSYKVPYLGGTNIDVE